MDGKIKIKQTGWVNMNSCLTTIEGMYCLLFAYIQTEPGTN